MGRPMVMKDRDADIRLTLLNSWRHSCIMCGRGFTSIDSVTLEHITPRSMGGKRAHNLAPSHHVCNTLRGKLSVLKGAALIESALYDVALQRGSNGVERFLATPVPNRLVDEEHQVRFRKQRRSILGI